MSTKTIQPRKPVVCSTGSATDNYFSPKPKDDSEAKRWQAFDSKSDQHKYILSMLHTMGWTKLVNGKTVGNMETFAHWLKTKSPVTKPLMEMSAAETSKVIYAFENVVRYQFK
ncbi:hypothetical protein [Flavobacterium sp. N1994]|uniref:hypothetical protein n=1 Tax=Flavobacterium sp. N1994 TaxID=2986827 RepID=UPI002221AFAE|nr:hypothetical protein [Flavobacterium sp. N1994]